MGSKPHPDLSPTYMMPPPTGRQNTYPPHTPSSLSQSSRIDNTPESGRSSGNTFKRGLAALAPSDSTRRPSSSGGGSDYEGEDKPGGPKKKRISLSCAQCAKRKQKCNRQFPCQHCIARKVPELCVPYNPQTQRDGMPAPPDPHTSARLDRMEDILSVILRHHGGLWSYQDVKKYMQAGPYSRLFPSTPSSPASPRRESLVRAFEHSVSPIEPRKPEPSSGATAVIGDHSHDFDDVDDVDGDGVGLGKGVENGWLGGLDGGVPESLDTKTTVTMKLDIHGTPAENLQRLITDCGVSPHKVAELVHDLPPKSFADRVVDWFFSSINHVRYPIDEQLFRASYDDLYDQSKAVDPSNVRALPLIFIVLATAISLAPEEWAGDKQTRRLSSLRMYWASRRSTLIATAVQSESLELVVTRLLSAMYLVLIHDRRLTECWSQLGASLRTAQAIGLHRDGSKLGLEPFEIEYRRRLWSYLYHADKLYSLVLGRPPSISDSYTDTQDPSNIEINDLRGLTRSDPVPPSLPLSEPTTATFLILRKSSSRIIGRIVHHFQKLDEPAQYSDVEALQAELDHFTENLPPHFRMYEPDKSLDQKYEWLPVHRMLLLSELLVSIIILHRPWLLRKLATNLYAASRTACFEAAKLDFQLRQDFMREIPNHRLYVTGQFKMFSSAMIAGISAIIDPRGPDGEQMRTILTKFLEQNPWYEAEKKDETTRKEVQIILTLSRRAAQCYEDSFGPEEADHPEKDSAGLLLALSRAGSNFSPKVESQRLPNEQTFSNGGALQMAHVAQATGMPAGPTFDPEIKPGEAPMYNAQEEDHSQRLLDHWIKTNSAMAFGPLGEAVPISNQPSGDFTYGLGQLIPALGADFPTPPLVDAFRPIPAWDGGITPFPMGAGPMMGANPNGSGSMGLGVMPSAQDLPASQGGEMAPGFAYVPGENSDEYWNTLIDGILGTTTGSAT